MGFVGYIGRNARAVISVTAYADCLSLKVWTVAGDGYAFHDPYIWEIVAGGIVLAGSIVPEGE